MSSIENEPIADNSVVDATTNATSNQQADNTNNNTNSSSDINDRFAKPVIVPLPEQTAAPWYEWILYTWVSPLLDRGASKHEQNLPVTQDDLMRLPAHEDPVYNYGRIVAAWNEELAKRDRDPEYKPDVEVALREAFMNRFVVGNIFRLIADAAAFALPFLLREYTKWLLDPEQEVWIGWMWLLGLVGANVVTFQCLSATQQHMLTAFHQMRNCLRLLVFESCLRYPAAHEDTGKIMAAHSQDTEALVQLAMFSSGLFVSPFIILCCIPALWFFLGYSGLITFGILVLTTPLQGIIMRKLLSLRPDFQKATADRTNALSELLQGIRICKFMCWEENFSARIAKTRETELDLYTIMQNWRIPLLLLIVAMPPITNFCAFAIEYALEGVLHPEDVFPALTMLNAIRIPLMFIPLAWNKYFDVKIALSRVSEVASFRGRYDYANRLPDSDNKGFAMEMENITVLGTESEAKKKKKDGKKDKTKEVSSPSADVGSPAKPTSSSSPLSSLSGGGAVIATTSTAPSSPESYRANYGDSNNSNNNNSNNNDNDDDKNNKNNNNSNNTNESSNVKSDTKNNEQNCDEKQNEASEPKKPKQQVIAKDLSLSIPKGKLTVVCGATASGKSTLIKALIGEAEVARDSKGSLLHYGTSAYVPQEPWIMNASARDNITMGTAFDQEKYDSVAAACQLTADFEQFPDGDLTEIGERGVSISGGQKQRLALCRAVYSNRDIVLMDDPLSAVDPHVCTALFEQCICGALQDKTRVLVTHQVQLVPEADFVVLMKDCAVAFKGTVDELRASGMYDSLVASRQQQQQQQQEQKKSSSPSSPSSSSPSTTKSGDAATAAATAGTDMVAAKSTDPTQSPTTSSPAADGKMKEENAIQSPQKVARHLFTKEADQAGTVEWSTYLWYLDLGGTMCFGFVLFFALLAAGTFVISNLILALWSSGQGSTIGDLEPMDYLMYMGIFTACGTVLLVLRQLFFVSFVVDVARNVHGEITDNVLRAPSSFFDTTPLGRLLNRFTKDVGQMDFVIFESLQMVINLAFAVLAAFATVCVSAPYILVLLPFLIIYFIYVFNHYSNTVRGLKRLDGSSQSPVVAIVNETVGGLASIRCFGISEQLCREHEKRTAIAAGPIYNQREAQRWLSVRTDLVGTILLACATMFGVISRHGDMSSWLPITPALTALAISSAITSTNTISMLTRTLAEFETAFTAVERVKQYTDSLPQEEQYNYDEEGHEPAPGPSWPAQPTIEFANVKMRYRPGLPLVLDDISFQVPAGSKSALVGRTGSGKSSLLLALLRMVEPASGSVFIDGRDTAKLDLYDLRSAITIIPQDPMLFSGSVRGNLDPFGQRTEDELWAVLDKLHLRERLTTFITDEKEPKGLDAVVREKGSNFSVGERQLLCLARALMKRSKILLLDEATASVDNRSDALIQKIIREEFQHCTVLTIAHRLGTIIDSDLVIVLSQGKVEEIGKPAQLLEEEHGAFRNMVEKLGPEQFELLSKIAGGALSYAEALKIDTSYETK